MSAVDIAADALAADEALIERKKMLAGEACMSFSLAMLRTAFDMLCWMQTTR